MRRRFAVGLAAVVGVFLFAAPGAFAAPVTKTLSHPLTGSSSTNIFDEDFECCDISIGDPINFDGNISGGISLDMATAMNAPGHNDLKYTDTNLRQGRTLDLTNTYTKDGGSFDVNYTLAVNLHIYVVDFNLSKSAGDSLSCSLPLLNDTCSHTKDIKIADFTVLDVGVAYANVQVFANIETTAHINGNGFNSDRTLTVAGADALTPGVLTFTSSPQTKDESVFLSCSLPPDEPVNYAMNNPRSDVNGDVQEGFGIGVGGAVFLRDPIFGDHELFSIGPFNFHLFSLPPVTFNTIHLTAPSKNVDLGTLQKNNIAPQKKGPIVQGGTLVEGSDVTFKANYDSPCGKESLHYVWRFSNPNNIREMVAYGETAHVVFPDNGIYSGTMTVTDPTGLSSTEDIAPFTIANANPNVDPVSKTAEWGDVVQYHADSWDPGKEDQSSLAYKWMFGDGQQANGQDVSHAFAMPGSYNGTVKVTDKDTGNTTSTAFITTIAKRGTSLVYDGATSALTMTSPQMHATLADDHHQAVDGGLVHFSLGALSTDAQANSSGLAGILLPLGLTPGDLNYALGASYAGDARYLPSSSGLPNSFRVNKRKTTLTYLGDTNARPNKTAWLAARLTDELNQPVAGAVLTFVLGAQSAAATTDAAGFAHFPLTLNQGPGAYPLVVSYAGNIIYLGSSESVTFAIPANNGAATALPIQQARGTKTAKGSLCKAVRVKRGFRRCR